MQGCIELLGMQRAGRGSCYRPECCRAVHSLPMPLYEPVQGLVLLDNGTGWYSSHPHFWWY